MTIDEFITFWEGAEGGAERANYVRFLDGLIDVLGLPQVPLATKGKVTPDYGYEARVTESTPLGAGKRGRVDLYRRNHFIIEAKQSHIPPGAAPRPLADYDPAAPAEPAPPPVLDLFGHVVATPAAPPPKQKKRAYDRLMEDALAQARGYALALPADHGWPPFLIVCDIGRAFELFFDWTGNGKGYGFFPDQASYRIELEDLRKPEVQVLLRGIWNDTASVDPRQRAALVTRQIAERLAKVSQQLEADKQKLLHGVSDFDRSLGIEDTAMFLMRVVFCMFAEDVGLLPKGKFQTFLAEALDKSDMWWTDGLRQLWSRMNDPVKINRFWSYGDDVVRYFNGNLFENAKTYTLPKEHKGELLAAAKCDWKAVEPAIFGTLLEQALTPEMRAKLGAHYTPRPYVERLVEATIMEVLRAEWDVVRGIPSPRSADAESPSPQRGEGEIAPPSPSRGEGDSPEASGERGARPPQPTLAAVQAFHDRLANIRILDPACGTGNFLYVAMENLLRLESDVLVLIAQLGGKAVPRVGPNQFMGLELNPRAAVIAELVLWIGWLRFRLANDPDSIGEPVLPKLTAINGGRHGGYDALLAADPSTGIVDLENPLAAAWPEADFIVGNPPFIGGKDLRDKLGGDYAEALWKADPGVPKSADLVMQWWDRAAARLVAPDTRLRRFGFVTTNSITQSFSRRVIAARLEGECPLSLTMAIADHPWTKASKDAAAVRIAMTVAQKGEHEGELIEITGEAGLDTDAPVLTEQSARRRINADLSVGTYVGSTVPLRSNLGLASRGVQLMSAGFIVTPQQAEALGLGKRIGLERHILPYANGRDLLQRSRGVMVIDLFGLSEKEVRDSFPEVYQHLLKTVKPERDINRRATYRDKWWIFGEPRRDLRPAIAGLKRYIVTVETAARRVFHFVESGILPDNKLIVIAVDASFDLGVLSSRVHIEWWLANAGMMGVYDRPAVYVKTSAFDPFPFPNAKPAQRDAIGDLAQDLDMQRRAALDENPGLTMTGLYNMVERIRSGAAMNPAEEGAAVKARARIVAKLHDDLDAAVAAAYGWPANLTPSEIVTRLVALNAERAVEEKAGHIRWLRPDYQAKAKA